MKNFLYVTVGLAAISQSAFAVDFQEMADSATRAANLVIEVGEICQEALDTKISEEQAVEKIKPVIDKLFKEIEKTENMRQIAEKEGIIDEFRKKAAEFEKSEEGIKLEQKMGWGVLQITQASEKFEELSKVLKPFIEWLG